MRRTIIQIDPDKCNGCGTCVRTCHEGAIGFSGGKAKLMRADHCDGLGNCLEECPQGAITLIECDFPDANPTAVTLAASGEADCCSVTRNADASAPLKMPEFPIQIKLVSPAAPRFSGCELLVAADCTAFMLGDFKSRIAAKKSVVIGCPKLDDADYSEKLAQVISANNIKSVTVARMEVGCCGGLERMVKRAVERSGATIPVTVITVGIDGVITEVR